MREIKFRAWDKNEKNMISDPLFIYSWGIAYTATKEWEYEFSPGRYASSFEWMQYTWLKDKNGKEIYEGDILRITTTFHSYNLAIKWNNEHANFCFDTSEPENYWWLDERSSNSEIVGNIYETPELLSQ